MTREERKLQKHFQQHANDQLRKAAQKNKKQQHRFDRRNDRRAPLDYDEQDVVHVRKPPPAAAEEVSNSGMVIETGAGVCLVAGPEAIRCKCDSAVAVGDRVLFSNRHKRVLEVLPRSSSLSRPDPHNPRVERVIAANIDIVVNVVSVMSPPLRPGLIDRYLIAIENSGAEPLICVNKADLIEDGGTKIVRLLKPYREIGVAVVLCSADTREGLPELAGMLAGRTCVFAGHSGVGKSSLLNALVPGLEIETRTVSQVRETGRHTTTASKLYRLPGGGVIIDTPGIREFGLWQVTAPEVRRYFHEFDPHSVRCGFSDCSHTHEPNCAVVRAVADGAVSTARYDSYRRIMESIE